MRKQKRRTEWFSKDRRAYVRQWLHDGRWVARLLYDGRLVGDFRTLRSAQDAARECARMGGAPKPPPESIEDVQQRISAASDRDLAVRREDLMAERSKLWPLVRVGAHDLAGLLEFELDAITAEVRQRAQAASREV